MICGAGVRNRVRMSGPHPVLRLEGSTGCSQVRLEVEFKDGGAANSCHRWALPASATEISPGWREPHFESLGSPTCCADAGEGRVPCSAWSPWSPLSQRLPPWPRSTEPWPRSQESSSHFSRKRKQNQLGLLISNPLLCNPSLRSQKDPTTNSTHTTTIR